MTRLTLYLLLCFLLAGFAACSGGAPKDEGQPVTNIGGAAPQPSGIAYQAPDGWIEESPTGDMRKGQFRLPRVEGDDEDAVMAVFYFGPGRGGSVQANIDRWIGQFAAPGGGSAKDSAQISTKEVNGQTVTILDVSGTYITSMGPMTASGAPKPNYRLLAAIVDTPEGPWFFKLTGPKNTIDRWEESFNQFTESIRVG